MVGLVEGKLPPASEEEVAARLSFAQAALGAAGHQVTDPHLLDVLTRHARGEISGDEARELGIKHVYKNTTPPTLPTPDEQ